MRERRPRTAADYARDILPPDRFSEFRHTFRSQLRRATRDRVRTPGPETIRQTLLRRGVTDGTSHPRPLVVATAVILLLLLFIPALDCSSTEYNNSNYLLLPVYNNNILYRYHYCRRLLVVVMYYAPTKPRDRRFGPIGAECRSPRLARSKLCNTMMNVSEQARFPRALHLASRAVYICSNIIYCVSPRVAINS